MLIKIDRVTNWGDSLDNTQTQSVYINTYCITRIEPYSYALGTGTVIISRVFVTGNEFFMPVLFENIHNHLSMLARPIRNLLVDHGSNI